MPTEIYKVRLVHTISGEPIEITPLKIKYLKQLMSEFSNIYENQNEDEKIAVLVDCVRIAMKQFKPEFSLDNDLIEDNFDLKNIYKILDYSAKIKMSADQEIDPEDMPKDELNDEGEIITWENLDLAKLESEVFLIGIWKNFEELESSLCLEELMKILSSTRELDYEEKKFLAAIQGINLDEQTGQVDGQKAWEDLKARVASGGATSDSNDILALQGTAAAQAGFGIGMGLSYESYIDESKLIKK